jgi:hypothetical protein
LIQLSHSLEVHPHHNEATKIIKTVRCAHDLTIKPVPELTSVHTAYKLSVSREPVTRAALRFKQDHAATIHDFQFKREDLVLVRNTAIEKALNRKMRPRYFGPMIVISRSKGGAYIIYDLDGTLLHAPVAAFRVVPYLVCARINIPDLEEHIDISVTRLREMEHNTAEDPDNPEEHDRQANHSGENEGNSSRDEET